MSAISPTEYETRVKQLEKLNATLAAEIDRMRPVVEAAVEWGRYSYGKPDHDELLQVVTDYEESQPK